METIELVSLYGEADLPTLPMASLVLNPKKSENRLLKMKQEKSADRGGRMRRNAGYFENVTCGKVHEYIVNLRDVYGDSIINPPRVNMGTCSHSDYMKKASRRDCEGNRVASFPSAQCTNTNLDPSEDTYAFIKRDARHPHHISNTLYCTPSTLQTETLIINVHGKYSRIEKPIRVSKCSCR